MKLDIDKLNKFFRPFQVVLGFMLVNLYYIVLSILSLGILTPALICGLFDYYSNLLKKNYDFVTTNYFKCVWRVKKKAVGMTIGPTAIIIIILLSLFHFNSRIVDNYSPVVFSMIVLIQILVLFELVNIVLCSLIQLSLDINKSYKLILRDAFLIVNSYIIRFILASISIIIVYYLITINLIFLFVCIALMYFLYYRVVIDTVRKTLERIEKKILM